MSSIILVKASDIPQSLNACAGVVGTNGDSRTGVILLLLFIETLQLDLHFASFSVKRFTSLLA